MVRFKCEWDWVWVTFIAELFELTSLIIAKLKSINIFGRNWQLKDVILTKCKRQQNLVIGWSTKAHLIVAFRCNIKLN